MSNETYLTLIGRLTADPEVRVTPQGATLARFTLATNARLYNRQTSAWDDGPASFHDCEVWNSQAEHVRDTLSKGCRVIVYGTLHQVAFTTREGENRRKWIVKIDDIGPSLRFVSAVLSESDGVKRSQQPKQQPPASVGSDPWASSGEVPY